MYLHTYIHTYIHISMYIRRRKCTYTSIYIYIYTQICSSGIARLRGQHTAACCLQYVAHSTLPREQHIRIKIYISASNILLWCLQQCVCSRFHCRMLPMEQHTTSKNYIKHFPASNIFLWCLLQYLARGCVSAALSCSRINIKRAVHCEQHTAETAIDIIVIDIIVIDIIVISYLSVAPSPRATYCTRHGNIHVNTLCNTRCNTHCNTLFFLDSAMWLQQTRQ